MKRWLLKTVKRKENGKPIISLWNYHSMFTHPQSCQSEALLFMSYCEQTLIWHNDSLLWMLRGRRDVSWNVSVCIRTSRQRKRSQNIPSPSDWSGMPPGLEDPLPLTWAAKEADKDNVRFNHEGDFFVLKRDIQVTHTDKIFQIQPQGQGFGRLWVLDSDEYWCIAVTLHFHADRVCSVCVVHLDGSFWCINPITCSHTYNFCFFKNNAFWWSSGINITLGFLLTCREPPGKPRDTPVVMQSLILQARGFPCVCMRASVW